MELHHSSHEKYDLIKITGRIDASTSDQLEQLLKTVQDGGRYDIILDMTDVDFISSRGFWVMVEAQKAGKKEDKGELVLAAIPGKIRESLVLIGMLPYFAVFDDVAGAIGNF
ncbi:MAG TPA: STAS domain-containing protein [Anaerolineales bacterium]|nr:STAS domain-containing protein [Anaerolineales bacterium]